MEKGTKETTSKNYISSFPEIDTHRIQFLEVMQEIVDLNVAESIKIVKSHLEQSPQNYFFYVLISNIYSRNKDKVDAFNSIEEGIKKFPNVYTLKSTLAKLYLDFDESDKALNIYMDSLDSINGSDTVAKSECLSDIASFYFMKDKLTEALNYWKLALIEDPTNEDYLFDLIVYSDKFDEIKSITPKIDDFLLFVEIKFEKYLSEKERKDFEDEDEKRDTLYYLMDIWENKEIINYDELAKLSPQEKINLLNSIEIDFSNEVDDKENYDDWEDEISDTVEFGITDSIDPDELILLPFTPALLGEIGMNVERIFLLLTEKVEPTDFERHIVNWALSVVVNFKNSFFEKKKKRKKQFYNLALEIAKEELDDDEIENAFSTITRLIKKTANI